MKIKFNLSSYEPIDEGERILAIKDAKCVPSGKPTKIEVTFVDIITNRTLKSTYSISSDGAMAAFAVLCRTALDLPDMSEFDTVSDMPKLVNKKLVCNVVHTEGNQPKEDGTFPIFANISKIIELYDGEAQVKTETVSPRNSILTDDLM